MKLPAVEAWAVLSVDGKADGAAVCGAAGARSAVLLDGGAVLPEGLPDCVRAGAVVAVFSDDGKLHPDAEVLLQRCLRFVIFTTRAMPENLRNRLQGMADLRVEPRGRRVDLRRALGMLADDYGVRRAVCAGSPELLRSLVAGGLLGALHVEFVPRICGGERAPTLLGEPGRSLLARSIPMRLEKFAVRGGRCIATYVVRGGGRRGKFLADTRGAGD